MLLLAVLALWVARLIERSRLGFGFATIRDDELAAEASGVPTLRLKLIATALSGALMGMAGAPLPYYIGYVEPSAAFGLPYAVNSIAMPMIGGTTSWVGPLIGAILLGTLQQIATVTISSVVNLLIVGVLLVTFVIAAPVGIVGLMQEFLRTAAPGTPEHAIDRRHRHRQLLLPRRHPGRSSSICRPSRRRMRAVASMGVFGLVVGALNLTAAYGLLKLQSWARAIATLAFAAAIVLAATHIWLDRAAQGFGVHSVMIGIALVAHLVSAEPRRARSCTVGSRNPATSR